jgi:hypothetical protein
MAKPSDYPRKIRYGGSNSDVGEIFMLDTPVQPVLCYEKEDLPDLAKLILEAIANTAEWQYIRKLMLEAQPAGVAGGEGGSDLAAPAHTLEVAQAAYQRARDPEAGSLHYSRTGDAASHQERYARRERAHAEWSAEFARFNESRKGVSERIAAHAMRHGLGYAAAAHDLGLTAPNVLLPTAAPC